MELKFLLIRFLSNISLCSNRTFMELKYVKANSTDEALIVLIAPLWN